MTSKPVLYTDNTVPIQVTPCPYAEGDLDTISFVRQHNTMQYGISCIAMICRIAVIFLVVAVIIAAVLCMDWPYGHGESIFRHIVG